MPTTVIDKEELCRKIRLLPDEMTPLVSHFLDQLMDDDEEPLSEDELLALKEAEAEIAAGNFDTWENVKRRLSELP